jgi:hypothetical protein
VLPGPIKVLNSQITGTSEVQPTVASLPKIPQNTAKNGRSKKLLAGKILQQRFLQRWASASRKLTPASAFRHLSSQSGTGGKNAGLRRFIPVPDRFRHR